jgi:hypothetical protein
MRGRRPSFCLRGRNKTPNLLMHWGWVTSGSSETNSSAHFCRLAWTTCGPAYSICWRSSGSSLLMLQVRRNLAAIRHDLRNDLFVKPDIHVGGVIGIAGIFKLLRKLLARVQTRSLISSAFIKSTIDLRHSSFPVWPQQPYPKLGQRRHLRPVGLLMKIAGSN